MGEVMSKIANITSFRQPQASMGEDSQAFFTTPLAVDNLSIHASKSLLRTLTDVPNLKHGKGFSRTSPDFVRRLANS